MRLTADQFTRILKRLKSDVKPEKFRDNRALPRVGLRMQLTIVPCVEGEAPRECVAWIRDLSRTGIGLIFDEPLEVGSYFLAQFKRGKHTLTAVYRVAHCAARSDNQYHIGAALLRTMESTLGNNAA